MDVKPPRPYVSPHRAEQANATRRRLLAAAETLFAERGFSATTMGAIASTAGVSPATVYLYFPSKAAIVAGLAAAITDAPDLSVEQVEGELDPVSQLRVGAAIIRRLNERSWLVADVLRGAQGGEQGLAEIWTIWQQQHLDAVQRGVAALHARGALRAGLPLDEAVDTFYALAGTDVYRALVRERGWSPDRYEAWLFRLGCAELLGISSPPTPNRPGSLPSPEG
ncbi:MAG: helix-turn-helix domain-containing protein [Thermomicrobiales bacterium]